MMALRRSGRLALTVGLLVIGSACGISGGGDDEAKATSTTAAAPAAAVATTATTVVPATVATTIAPTTAAAPTTVPPTVAPPLPPPTVAPPLPLPVDEALQACGPPSGTWYATTFTTARFVVHICESTTTDDLWYRGRNRATGDRIDLPAYFGDVGYAADNGATQYYVSNDVLAVYNDGELILEEPVLSVE